MIRKPRGDYSKLRDVLSPNNANADTPTSLRDIISVVDLSEHHAQQLHPALSSNSEAIPGIAGKHDRCIIHPQPGKLSSAIHTMLCTHFTEYIAAPSWMLRFHPSHKSRTCHRLRKMCTAGRNTLAKQRHTQATHPLPSIQ